MSKKAQRTLFLAIGSFLIILGQSVMPEEPYFFTTLDVIGVTLNVIGGVVWLYGYYLWVNLKGRHWAWMFWGFLWPFGLIAIVLLEDRSHRAKLTTQECLAYLEEEWKLKAFQSKEADLWNNGLVKYGNSMVTDSLASKEMCKAAKRLQQATGEILRRRGRMVSIVDMAAVMYSKWGVAYLDYQAWAEAQCAAIEAVAEGMVPNSERVKELLSQAEKSRSQAEKEERKLIKRLKLSAADLSRMLASASAAVADESWQPPAYEKEESAKVRVSRKEFAEVLYYWVSKDLSKERLRETAKELDFEIKSDKDLHKIFGDLLILNMCLTVVTAYEHEGIFGDKDRRNDCLDLLHHLVHERHFEETEISFHNWMLFMGARYTEYKKAMEARHPAGPLWEVAKTFNKNLFGKIKKDPFVQVTVGEHIASFQKYLGELIQQYDVE